MVTDRFKLECKNGANNNRLAEIILSTLEEIKNTNYLQSLSIDSGCYSNGNIIGTIYSKKLVCNLLSLPNSIVLTEKDVNVKIGVRYPDNTEEMTFLGKYSIEKPTDEQTNNQTQFTAYDSFSGKIDKEYICNIDFSLGNITTKDFYEDVCSQLGLIPKNTNFINNNISVQGNPFTNKETNRIVLQNIEQISCTFAEIDEETNEIDLIWLSNSVDPDYTFETTDYSTLEGGKEIFGPVNSLVIKDSQIEGENVSINDSESISLNGETQITIEDNYFLYTQELRQQAINGIWDRIHNLQYTECKLTTYYGKPFIKCGQKIRVNTNDDRTFDTYVLLHNFAYDGAFTSIIESPLLTKKETQIKNLSISEKFRNVERITNKIDGQMKDVIENQTEQQNQLAQMTMDINSIQNLFQVTGGSNLIKNSVGLFNDNYWSKGQTGTFAFGEDNDLIGKTNSSAKITISNGTLTTTNDNIKDLTINIIKSLSFKIKQDANTTTTISVYGLSLINPLFQKTFDEEMDWQEFYDDSISKFFVDNPNLTIKIESSSLYDGQVQISDLMLNDGDKSSWQPATSEIWGTVIKMSQLGISCYSVEGNYITMMTTQGFQVRQLHGDNIGEIISKFTDLGIFTGIIEQTGKHIIKNLVTDIISSQGKEIYVEYIKDVI